MCKNDDGNDGDINIEEARGQVILPDWWPVKQFVHLFIYRYKLMIICNNIVFFVNVFEDFAFLFE